MNRSRNLRRRKFLKLAASAAASSAAVSCGGRPASWRFLTAQEAATLAAMCDQIIPPDKDPGAAWAGAVSFIDRHLTGHLKALKQTYRQGLAAVDQTSLMAFRKAYAELAAAQQIEILKMLEASRAPSEIWGTLSPRQFLDLVVSHTLQSYYGDPRHGGNRDAVSWRMLGVPLVPIRGREQYDLSKPGIPNVFPRREKWARKM